MAYAAQSKAQQYATATQWANSVVITQAVKDSSELRRSENQNENPIDSLQIEYLLSGPEKVDFNSAQAYDLTPLAGLNYRWYVTCGTIDKYFDDQIIVLFENVCVNAWIYLFAPDHKVVAKVDEDLLPIPVNITTVNKIFGLSISSEEEMKKWLDENREAYLNPSNGKEAALNKVGAVLYEKMFRHYT
ncbi:MAG: hypothetical protein EOO00_13360, partial [Chitinophagaceae bacterium]